MTRRDRLPLGPLENAVMQIVWVRKTATADEVRNALRDQQEFKESTIRTILSRLEAKGYLAHDVEDRTYIYRSLISQQDVRRGLLGDLLDRLFEGSPRLLLNSLVEENKISEKEMREIRKLIEEREKK